MRVPSWLRSTLAVSLFATGLTAQAQQFTVAYQTVPTPSLAAQADGAYEKATGLKSTIFACSPQQGVGPLEG